MAKPDSHPKRDELDGRHPGGPDRHIGRGPDRHAGPADGQARPGPGVPQRGHRPRRPLLHVPARHGHGDEHAGRVRAHELGDRLRRLDRGPGVGHLSRGPVAGADGDRPVRHRRPPRQRDPGLAPHPAQEGLGPRGGGRLPGDGRVGVRVLPADRYLRAGPCQGVPEPRAVRLLQRGLPPPAGDQGRADPRSAAQPHDRGRHPGRVLQGRGCARPARGEHPLRPTSSRWPTSRCCSSTGPRRSPG